MQVPFEQLSPILHEPHVPPQPSAPHSLPAHCLAQQVPEGPQLCPVGQLQSSGQLAQFSPAWHRELPHAMSGRHWPFVQLWPTGQLPQLPPQPSEPHVLPLQDAEQHAPPKQLPESQTQSMQVEQVSPAAGLHTSSPQSGAGTQAPLSHMLKTAQDPQLPRQPSSPQVFPSHDAEQQLPAMQALPFAQPQSSGQLSQVSPVSHVELPQPACVMHLFSAQSLPLGHTPQS